MKFLLTLWTEEIDPWYTGDHTFEVLGEFPDLPSAQAYEVDNMDRLIAEQLSRHSGWRLMEQVHSGELTGLRDLKDNKVVDHRFFRVGDGTLLHHVNASLILIELPADAVVDENLFDLATCDYFVKPYFARLRKQ